MSLSTPCAKSSWLDQGRDDGTSPIRRHPNHQPSFQSSYQILAQPFEWKFTRADLARLLEHLEQKTSGRLREAA